MCIDDVFDRFLPIIYTQIHIFNIFQASFSIDNALAMKINEKIINNLNEIHSYLYSSFIVYIRLLFLNPLLCLRGRFSTNKGFYWIIYVSKQFLMLLLNMPFTFFFLTMIVKTAKLQHILLPFMSCYH